MEGITVDPKRVEKQLQNLSGGLGRVRVCVCVGGGGGGGRCVEGNSEKFWAGLCRWNFEYNPYSYNFQTDKTYLFI